MRHLQQPSLVAFNVPAVAYCCRCGRQLTDPKSVKQGIGPICIGHTRGRDAQEENPAMLDPFNPETMDITCRRDAQGRPIFNIEQRHVSHSPSGMEFGYGGSGPADFALNVLALFLPVQGEPRTEWGDDGGAASAPNAVEVWGGTVVSVEAYRLYQQFKEEFIATLPEAGGTIRGSDIRAWIAARAEPQAV